MEQNIFNFDRYSNYSLRAAASQGIVYHLINVKSCICKNINVSFCMSSGKYMYIETSSPRKPGEKAKLLLTVPDNGKQSCFSFYFHMYGASAGTLNVYNGNHTVFNVSGDQGNNWHKVETDVFLHKEVSDLLFCHSSSLYY